MTVFECMRNRASKREFTSEKIGEGALNEILEAVRRAPSTKNSQPWKLTLVEGARLERLRQKLCEKFDEGAAMKPDFSSALPPAYKPRAVDLGKKIFIHKGIAREDKAARRRHDRENFLLFGAPQAFILSTIPEHSEANLMDLGIFSGYLMLALEAAGLATCPQVSPAYYPDAIREVLPELGEEKIAMVFPFGVAKPGSHVNEFRSPREEVGAWFRRLGEL